jgi:hypothetical protein
LGVPLPKPMATAAEFALNGMLRREIETEPLDVARVHSLIEQVRSAKVTLDETTLEYAARKALEKVIRQFAAEPDNFELLSRIEVRVGVVNSLPFPVAAAEYLVRHATYRLRWLSAARRRGRQGCGCMGGAIPAPGSEPIGANGLK